ncbi:MAG: hypothetical protein AB9856_00895 [Cellulosilyticaceae bacterium]
MKNALCQKVVLNKKGIRNFWVEIAELKEVFINNQQLLTNQKYGSDLNFTAFIESLWNNYVRFAISDKRVRDYTVVDWCLIKGRALQLARLDCEIELEKYATVAAFVESNCHDDYIVA